MGTEEIKKGLEAAFINRYTDSNLAYRPQFVSNSYEEGNKVLSAIENELNNCDEFYISVAFITLGGIKPLLLTLKELEKRNIKGKILTTNYMTFSDPKALEELSAFKNIDLRLYYVKDGEPGFHTKGYIFKKGDIYKMITGSSNLTANALTRNKEWNIKVISTSEGDYYVSLMKEFGELWEKATPLDDIVDMYKKIYSEQKALWKRAKVPSLESYKLKPNDMQVTFSNNLMKLIDSGEKRALLISSTGTGKTYASAFALRNLNPDRVLFLVHRAQIAKQALKSYKRVFAESKKMGLLSGEEKDLSSDFLFSTMNMMAKSDIRERFKRDEFDAIVYDECHRIASKSYQDILDYFEPRISLGMSASPERMDGFDVFKAFDNNIAHEIRLEQALKEDLLCPFNYFGISDIEIDGEIVDDKTALKNFNLLTSDERVNHIIKNAEFFGYSGDRVKGLIFCSTQNEARELSNKFNKRNYKTTYLTGEHSQEYRENAVEKLVSEDKEDYLEYIFTVDIFNEGVDIPEINQIIMLRPTKSPVVFIQQLGRGLRKAENKEYVIIIDFIGNYNNNFMIPIALSGDRSFNKDTIRRYVSEGNRVIPGASTIHFDEITKKRIYESIDVTNFNAIRFIKESYFNLKSKLGKIPSLMDFEEHGEIDVLTIFNNDSLKSYHNFLKKYEAEYEIKISDKAEKYLEFISQKFASGKRIHELLMLKRMINYEGRLFSILQKELSENYNIKVDDNTKTNIYNVLTNEFATGVGKKTYEDCQLVKEKDNDFNITDQFYDELKDNNFREMVREVVEFGIYRNSKDYGKLYKDTTFNLYAKYTYDDVCRLLDWEKGEVALNIGGYKYDSKTKTYPVFINYEKDENIQDTVKYEDRFIDNSTLIAISKSGRTKDSGDVKRILNAEKEGIRMELFVRKNKDDKNTSKEFYYLGKIKPTGEVYDILMPNTNKRAVEIVYKLETPVRDELFEYLVK